MESRPRGRFQFTIWSLPVQVMLLGREECVPEEVAGRPSLIMDCPTTSLSSHERLLRHPAERTWSLRPGVYLQKGQAFYRGRLSEQRTRRIHLPLK